jgi:flavin-dependent dehydrogenase
MSQRVIVIGAEPGGLATALRLAGQGYQVGVFEAASQVAVECGGLRSGLVRSILGRVFYKCLSSTMMIGHLTINSPHR